MHALVFEMTTYVLFLLYRRPSGTDKDLFVQLFVDCSKYEIPSTQDLLTKTFNEDKITFAKVF